MVIRLRATGLVHEYPGPLRAVDGVDFELAKGELRCVLGPNGAGKTTLLKLLAGLLPPSAGEVRVDGDDLATLRPRERAHRIAVVPQELSALPEVTAFDFVLGGRYAHLGPFRRPQGSDREAVAAALEAADAGDLSERILTAISGGQRQRVLIARALAQEADVLLVDEPTSSLDPEHQLAVFDLLARLTCHGHAVGVVTHDLNLASQFATHLTVMQSGRVAAEGPPDAVLRPEVLEPVYGPNLHYGRLVGRGGERPFVLPWLP